MNEEIKKYEEIKKLIDELEETVRAKQGKMDSSFLKKSLDLILSLIIDLYKQVVLLDNGIVQTNELLFQYNQLLLSLQSKVHKLENQ